MAAVWNVPRIFLGQWRGVGADGPVGLDITLTIKAGKNSEEIATSSIIAGPSGARCDYVDRVILITDTELTFAPRPVGGANCLDEGKPYAVALSPDGSLAYRSPGVHGGTVAITLRRG